VIAKGFVAGLQHSLCSSQGEKQDFLFLKYKSTDEKEQAHVLSNRLSRQMTLKGHPMEHGGMTG
jgi:hypothetical protein